MNRWLRLLAGLREFNATQIELQERLMLLTGPGKRSSCTGHTMATTGSSTDTYPRPMVVVTP